MSKITLGLCVGKCVCVSACMLYVYELKLIRTDTNVYTHARNLLLHFTCLTSNFHVLLIDLSTRRVMIQMKRGKEERREGWIGGEKQMKKTLRLFCCPPPSASQQALTSCGSAAPQRHELTSKVMLKSTCTGKHTGTHTHTEAHTNNIHLLCSATLRRHKLITLKIESSYADGDSCAHMRL